MARATARIIVIVAALLMGSTALAQRIVISPQAIVVNPLPSFAVDVWLDRAPDARTIPSYAVGEPIRVSVRASEDGYVYLFSVGASGEVVQIVPNRFDDAGRDAFVRAGTTRHFPPQNARYGFTVDPPAGLAKVIAVASRRPLDTRTLAAFRSERDLLATSRLGEDGFARALSIVVQPLPQESWVTATALYYVGTRPAQGAYGTINVSSQPRGAEVFVDGQFAGFTPLRFGTRPGRYDVEVHLSGYVSSRETVQVRPDRSVDLQVSLQAHRGTRPTAQVVEPIHAFLGLLPYPGSEVTGRSGGSRDAKVSFTSTASLREIYQYFHEQLIRDGWRRTDLDTDDDEIEAEYRRERVSFELELEYKGRNRYELEFDFD